MPTESAASGEGETMNVAPGGRSMGRPPLAGGDAGRSRTNDRRDAEVAGSSPVRPVSSAATASALLHEVSEARRLYVDSVVNPKINRCHGECSNAEITEWENDAHRRWREKFPTLASFLIPHGEAPSD